MTALHTEPHRHPPDLGRILRENLTDAVALLDRRPLSDRAVHGVRKDLKHARAMLRLMRAGLGETKYHRANTVLRDVARELSAVRDSKVLLDTLGDFPQRDAIVEMQVRLRKEHILAREQLQTEVSAAKRARETLRAFGHAFREGPKDRCDWPVVQRGLQRVYAQARTAFLLARRHPTAETLHELRKQTKYLWHQLQTLAATRPLQRPLIAATHRLSDLLGGEHDLVTLRTRALGIAMRGGARKWLLAHIDARSARLREQTMRLAERIYQDPPAVFAAHALHGTVRRAVRRPPSTSF